MIDLLHMLFCLLNFFLYFFEISLLFRFFPMFTLYRLMTGRDDRNLLLLFLYFLLLFLPFLFLRIVLFLIFVYVLSFHIELYFTFLLFYYYFFFLLFFYHLISYFIF